MEQNKMAEETFSMNGDDKENFWKKILNEVSAQSSRHISSNKHVLILGNDCCGKTLLISKLQSPGEELLKKGAGLENTYFDVHDEERDEHTRLSVWIQDGNDQYKNLLNYVFNKDNVKDLLILICVDMSKPWELLESLEKWSQVLHEHLHSLQISAKDLNQMERDLVANFQKYKNMALNEDEDKKEVPTEPLDENILTNNIGIPIIIVVTKSDHMNVLETELEYREEHFDFIQKHLRLFCLKCGASLIYTSAKDSSNTGLLYRYLLKRLYDFPFHGSPQVIEKNAIFIPMGWDDTSKISILDEHIKSFNPNDPLKDHIVKPVSRKTISHEKEVHADDEQTFLEIQLGLLSKMPASTAGQRASQTVEHRSNQRGTLLSPNQRTAARSGVQHAKAKTDASKSSAQNSSETVLANFFNSLLSKNTTGKTGKTTPSTTSSRSDVQAELERMSKKTTKKDGDGDG